MELEIGMDETVLKDFEEILERIDGLSQISLNPKKDENDRDVLVFHLDPIEITEIEKMEGQHMITQHLEKPIPIGAFDVIIADGATEPLLMNTICRRKYGVLRGTKEILTWDHPHVLDMRIQSANFIRVVEPLMRSECWEDLISMTMLFLSTAVVDSDTSLKMLNEWVRKPTTEEQGLVS